MNRPSRRARPGPRTRRGRDLPPLAGLLEGSGRSGLAAWRDGVGLALIPVVYGLFPLLTGHAEFRSRGGRLVLEGGDARAVGLAAIALGAALHVHFFWGPHPRLADYRGVAEVVAFLTFLGAMAYLVFL